MTAMHRTAGVVLVLALLTLLHTITSSLLSGQDNASNIDLERVLSAIVQNVAANKNSLREINDRLAEIDRRLSELEGDPDGDSGGDGGTGGDGGGTGNGGNDGGDQAGLVSSEFDKPPASNWVSEDPSGPPDATVDAGSLRLGVVGPHDVWVQSNDTLRVVQSAGVSDFDVAVLFLTGTPEGTMQGIALNGVSGWFRLELQKRLGIRKAFFVPLLGSEGAIRSIGVPDTVKALRAKRTGDSIEAFYSIDGTTWNSFGSAMGASAISRVGIYAGISATEGPASFECRADWFRVLPPENSGGGDDGGGDEEEPPPVGDSGPFPFGDFSPGHPAVQSARRVDWNAFDSALNAIKK